LRFSGGFLEVFDASFEKSDLYSGRFSKANVVWLGVFETKSVLGCNNGGGGGNFLKVKQLVLKCIGTQKRLFPEILAARVGCSRCHNFLPGHITTRQPYIHI